MGENTSNDTVSMKTLQSFLPYATILVSIALSWGNLSSKIELLNQKADGIVEVARTADTRLNTLAQQQQDMALKLNTLATIIESAQNRGLLSQSSSSVLKPSTIAESTPQPSTNRSEATPQPQIVVNNTQQREKEKEPEEEKPKPTQPPQSQKPRPTQVPEFVNNLLSDVLSSIIL